MEKLYLSVTFLKIKERNEKLYKRFLSDNMNSGLLQNNIERRELFNFVYHSSCCSHK